MEYIYINVATGQVTDSLEGTAEKIFKPIIAGQSVSWRVIFLRPGSDGKMTEFNPQLLDLRVGVGEVDKRPAGGVFRIQVGEGLSTPYNTTNPISHNAAPDEVELELNNIPSKPSAFHCDSEGDSIVIRRVDGEPVFMRTLTEDLMPQCIGEILNSVDGRGRKYNLILRQAPVVYFNGKQTALPDAPTVTTIQDGYYAKGFGGTTYRNEIQRLYIPPDFKGTFRFLKPDTMVRTEPLSRASTISDIKKALDKIGEGENGVVVVTNPENSVAHIEFKSRSGATRGGWGAVNLPELQVEVFTSPPPYYEFTLNFSSTGLMQKFLDSDSVTLPFEGEGVEYIDSNDHSKGIVVRKLWRSSLVIEKPLLWEGLAAGAPIGWQSRIFQKNYIPFTQDQVLIGQQQAYTAMLYDDKLIDSGDDSAGMSYLIDHNLSASTTDPAAVAFVVREVPTGRILSDSEYSAFHISPNSMVVSIKGGAIRTKFVGDGTSTTFSLTHSVGIVSFSVTRDVPNEGEEGSHEETLPPEHVPPGVIASVNGNIVPVNAYSISRNGVGESTIDFATPPAAGSDVVVGTQVPSGYLAITIVGYGPASAFQSHTHTIPQIQGLNQLIEHLAARITALESLGRTQGITSSVLEGDILSGVKDKQVVLPSFGELIPDLLVEGVDSVSIASQLGSSSRAAELPGAQVTPPSIIEGTGLAEKQKELQAQFDKYKAEKEAEIKALAEKLKKEAEEKAKEQVKAAVTISRSLSLPAVTFLAPGLRGGKYAPLLSGVHGVSTAVSQLPSLPVAGSIYLNSGSGSIVLPGGGGRKSSIVAPGKIFGYSNGIFYLASQSGRTYYPDEMRVELVNATITNDIFPVGSTLDLKWALSLSLKSDTIFAGARYTMNLYAYPLGEVAAPSGPNMGSAQPFLIIGNPGVVLSKNVSEERQFELSISRSIDPNSASVITAPSVRSYGKQYLGDLITNGNFILKIVLEQWDVDDSTSLLYGQVSVKMPAANINFKELVQ